MSSKRCFILLALAGGLLSAAELPPVNFQRQVRPILSNNCFLCHGPDKGTRMADVRLDIHDGAFATRKNGTIIVPGKPKKACSSSAFCLTTLTIECRQRSLIRR